MKVYKDDALYGQNDPAEEIFFIIKGRVKLYYNIFCLSPDKDAQYVPCNICVEGSYFGDVEVILNQGRDVRKAMTVAKVESQLLVVTKKQILELLKGYPSIHKEMKFLAQRRLAYLNKSIEEVKTEFFGVINEEEKKPDVNESESDNFMMKSHFMRQNSQMRQGEITL